MNTARLKQIEDLYHKVLEIQPNERESFLDEHCREDIELRCEIETLLSFSDTSDNLLNTPPESIAAEMFAEQDEQTDLINREIEHYKIIKLIGKGGMGEVYLGRRHKT